jgi:hypothetical protein
VTGLRGAEVTETEKVRLGALEEAIAECLDVADSYPDPYAGEVVAMRAMILQSANVAKLCAERIRKLADEMPKG